MTQKCRLCGDLKNWSEFHNDCTKFMGINGRCKSCAKNQEQARRNTLQGFMYSLLKNAKNTHKVRESKGRQMGAFTLTIDHLLAKWKSQEGKCSYSGVLMYFDNVCNYKCSLERINNSISYTDENTVLIIQELNTMKKQITPELLKMLLNPDEDAHPQIDRIKQGLIPPQTGKRKPNTYPQSELDGVLWCKFCSTFQALKLFREGYQCNGCYKCRNENQKERRTKINVKLVDMLESTKRRNGTSLSLQNLYDKLLKQQGKCFYSGKNLSFDGRDHFHISLERLNSRLGYLDENTVLICEELNSPDQTSRFDSINKDDMELVPGGWNLSKFLAFKDLVKKYKPEMMNPTSDFVADMATMSI